MDQQRRRGVASTEKRERERERGMARTKSRSSLVFQM